MGGNVKLDDKMLTPNDHMNLVCETAILNCTFTKINVAKDGGF
jgi:hypothetical protein